MGKIKETGGNYTLCHKGQNHGHSIGVPDRSNPVPNMGIHKSGSGGGIFRTRGSVLRNCGKSGAHRIGKK